MNDNLEARKTTYQTPDKIRSKIREIMDIAGKLDWYTLTNKHPYPIMQLSEVEKCMIAMIDDGYLNQMRSWENPKNALR